MGLHKHRTSAIATSIAAVLSLLAAGAATGQLQRVTRGDIFLSRVPRTPTGLRVAIDYHNPANPSGKPPAVKTVIDRFAPGFRIDTGAPEQCLASNQELSVRGRGACPQGSVVGTGEIDVATGLVGPASEIRTAITFLNRTGQLIMLVTDMRTGARTVVRGQITGGDTITIPVRSMSGTPLPLPGEPIDIGAALAGNTAPAALMPGSPHDGGAIKRERLLFPRLVRSVGGRTRSYMTTPLRCPASRLWTNQSQYVFTDGNTTITTDHTACVARARRRHGTRRRAA